MPAVHPCTAQELNTFPFEVIKKWLPSNLRSRNVGPDNCLDLQIETDRGPRDLRMRTDSAATVKAIIQLLRDTVQVCTLLAQCLIYLHLACTVPDLLAPCLHSA